MPAAADSARRIAAAEEPLPPPVPTPKKVPATATPPAPPLLPALAGRCCMSCGAPAAMAVGDGRQRATVASGLAAVAEPKYTVSISRGPPGRQRCTASGAPPPSALLRLLGGPVCVCWDCGVAGFGRLGILGVVLWPRRKQASQALGLCCCATAPAVAHTHAPPTATVAELLAVSSPPPVACIVPNDSPSPKSPSSTPLIDPYALRCCLVLAVCFLAKKTMHVIDQAVRN